MGKQDRWLLGGGVLDVELCVRKGYKGHRVSRFDVGYPERRVLGAMD